MSGESLSFFLSGRGGVKGEDSYLSILVPQRFPFVELLNGKPSFKGMSSLGIYFILVRF